MIKRDKKHIGGPLNELSVIGNTQKTRATAVKMSFTLFAAVFTRFHVSIGVQHINFDLKTCSLLWRSLTQNDMKKRKSGHKKRSFMLQHEKHVCK